jgi:hypothetical protein
VLELFVAVACLAFSVLLLLGGLRTAFFNRFFAKAVEAQYGVYRSSRLVWPKTTYSTHVKLTRSVLIIGGAIGTAACVAWLVALAR